MSEDGTRLQSCGEQSELGTLPPIVLCGICAEEEVKTVQARRRLRAHGVRLHTIWFSVSGNFFFLFILRFPDCSSVVSQVGAHGRKSLHNATEEEIVESTRCFKL
jgi:hypothetical protein